jgi:hypothetical protein
LIDSTWVWNTFCCCDNLVSAIICHGPPPPLATLSDVGFSPQSTFHYRRSHPPVCALLPVKAVTEMTALEKPSLSLPLSLIFFYLKDQSF